MVCVWRSEVSCGVGSLLPVGPRHPLRLGDKSSYPQSHLPASALYFFETGLTDQASGCSVVYSVCYHAQLLLLLLLLFFFVVTESKFRSSCCVANVTS